MDRDGPDAGQLRMRAMQALDESDEWYKRYDTIARGAEEDAIAKEVVEGRALLRTALDGFASAIEKRDTAEILRFAGKVVPEAYNRTSDAFKKLKDFQITDAARQETENASELSTLRLVTVDTTLNHTGRSCAIAALTRFSRSGAPSTDLALERTAG